MGGKGNAPAAPDYAPIAASDTQAAQIAAQTSTDQLNWAKQQYADQQPYTNAFMQSAITAENADTAAQQQQMAAGQQITAAGLASMQQQQTDAQKAQAFYEKTYQPMEAQFAQTAAGYDSPQRAAQQAGAAEADVASAFAGQRQSALSSLESYGIDPSQTRYGALDLGTRISQAAAQSAAGTQSRLNTEATGLALQGEAINVGRGYPGQITSAYGGATSAGGGATGAFGGAVNAGAGGVGAGAAGVNAGLQTSNIYGNMMGSPTQWAQLQQGALGGATNALNAGFQNQLGSFNANAAIGMNTSSGIGSLVGAGIVGGAIIV